MLIQEFAYAFRLDYIIDRCGVISGPAIWKRRPRICKFMGLASYKQKKLKYMDLEVMDIK